MYSKIKKFILIRYYKNFFYKIIFWIIIVFSGLYIFLNILTGPMVGKSLPEKFAHCHLNICSGRLLNENYLFKKNDRQLLHDLHISGLEINKNYGHIPPLAAPYISHEYIDVPSSRHNPAFKLSTYTIKSPYPLPTTSPNHNHWVILVHGMISDWTYSFLIGMKLLEEGYSIAIYDDYSVMQRTKDIFGYYGSTGSGLVSFGLYESYGLQAVYKNISSRQDCQSIGIYGVSLGAATVMMFSSMFGNQDYLPKDSKLWYIFEDSGYYSFMHEVSYVIGQYVPLPFWMFYIGSFFSVLLTNGWDPYSINPGINISKSIVPMYFVQGTDDYFVSYTYNFKPLLKSYFLGLSFHFWKVVEKKIQKPIHNYFDFTVLDGSSHADSFFWDRTHNHQFIDFFNKIVNKAREVRDDYKLLFS